MKKNMLLAGLVLIASLSGISPVWAETAHVTVNGMVCAFCAQGIEKSFGRMDEVANSHADLDNRMVTITIKPGKQLPDTDIQKAIRDNGLDPVKIERSNP